MTEIRRAVVLLVALLLLAIPAAAQERQTSEDRLSLLYLGNEGFLLACGGQRVLIDSLHGAGLEYYVALPERRRELLETASPPFAQIDLVLATHHHGDHFDAGSVRRFLDHAPDAVFASTTQAVDLLRGEYEQFDAVASRVKGFAPTEGKPVRVELAGIKLGVLDLHHGRGGDVQNLGFIVEICGRRVLHMGDTEATPEDLAAYGLPDWKLDVALIPYWHFTSSNWEAFADQVRASRYVAMHIPARDAPADYFGEAASTQGEYVKHLRSVRPEVLLFWKPLQEELLD